MLVDTVMMNDELELRARQGANLNPNHIGVFLNKAAEEMCAYFFCGFTRAALNRDSFLLEQCYHFLVARLLRGRGGGVKGPDH